MSVRSETKPVTGMHLVVGLGGWLVYLVVLIAGIYLTQSFAGDLLGQRN
jgi:hypothetical protein